MKKRIIAILLLLVIALTACTSKLPIRRKNDSDTTRRRPKVSTVTEAGTEATEVPTEATEATEAPTQSASDIDLGTVDGNTYTNESLGITCTLPEVWYVYNETDIAALNNLVTSVFDETAIAEAIKSNQAVIIFCASEPASISSLNINVSKNTLPGVDEETLINLVLPQVKAQMEQTGVMQNLTCTTDEIEFCGQTHTVLNITAESYGMPIFESLLYLPCGDCIYALTASTYQADTTATLFSYFTSLN